MHRGNINTFTQPTVDAVALKSPINNPACAGIVSVNGTLAPQPSQNNFNTIKAPELYHFDGGLSNAPSGSQNFLKLVMMEDTYKLPCLGMPNRCFLEAK